MFTLYNLLLWEHGGTQQWERLALELPNGLEAMLSISVYLLLLGCFCWWLYVLYVSILSCVFLFFFFLLAATLEPSFVSRDASIRCTWPYQVNLLDAYHFFSTAPPFFIVLCYSLCFILSFLTKTLWIILFLLSNSSF